jgi:hypothetical protein
MIQELYKKIMSFKATVFFTFLFFLRAYGQEIVEFQIKWKEPLKVKFNAEETSIPSIEGQEPSNGKPVFFSKVKLSSTNYQYTLVDYQTEAAPISDRHYLEKHGFDFGNELNYELKVTHAGKESFAVIYLFPYVMENNELKRVVGFKTKLTPKATVQNKSQKSFTTQSVLSAGNGTWYKISVARDGIYKIDKAFLDACGISLSGVHPDAIHIYGNGDGRLPELNSVDRTDDLAQNAIQMFGDSDGSFDEGDYFLFYGWGPSRWSANGLTEMNLDKNIYSDVSCYYININQSEPPLRIQLQALNTATPNQVVTSYSFCDVYENDFVNLVGGGQRWYGELFDTDLEQVFNFYVPDIVAASPAYFKTAVASNANSAGGTAQEYSVNGNILSSSVLPAVSYDYARSVKTMNLTNPTASLPFKIKITRNSPSTIVYLDRILLNARRSLIFYNSQFNFRDLQSVGTGNICEFNLTSLPSTGFIWDVTDRHLPSQMQGVTNSTSFSFVAATDTLREFVASNGTTFLTPSRIGLVSSQNLHGLSQADMLLITHRDFLSQANRLAALHESEGLSVHVVTTDQVYNEFSSGMLDPTAIRMFAKMFYDRSVSSGTPPKYLLLFGDGTYDPKDRVSNNNNYVPTYQVLDGENHISALVTDDYYGMLDNNEAITPTDLLDIGVGRLLISDTKTAKEQVDKIEHYMKNGSSIYSNSANSGQCNAQGASSTFGDWRLNYVQIADDEEGGYFVVQDTEPQYDYVKANHRDMNCDKLYCDAYTQVTTAGGERYPDIFNAITDRVERGALVVNYVGHGGEVGLAEERVVTVPQIQSWSNINKLNLFVSATCEFTKYDDPARLSAGEYVSLNAVGGAIALMTTSRSVFFGVNTVTGLQFYEHVFTRDSNNEPLAFGEIMRLTKNGSGSSDNKRSFTLIGDPALKIALPRLRVVTDTINGLSPVAEIDTIRALSKVTIKGHLEDFNGNLLSNFNGIVTPSILDKPKNLSTLGQNADSPVIDFELQKNIVYKGKATVTNGNFAFSFIVPKDINFSYSNGKISYYASDIQTDASGSDDRLIIGGIDPNGITDTQGPDISLYINDKNFVSGGITDETPQLLAELFDENGINTVGNGIGHDLTVILDDNTANPIVLNDYYSAALDSYQSGEVNYSFPTLEKGKHKLTVKVWDVNNNSSEKSIDFIVQEKAEMALDHVLNYPNPFTTKTQFYFEHNQVCSQLETQIQIFTVSGRLVRTLNQIVNTEGFRSQGIDWDGRDDFGDQLAKGVYVYTLKVNSPDGTKAEKTEKLVLLK